MEEQCLEQIYISTQDDEFYLFFFVKTLWCENIAKAQVTFISMALLTITFQSEPGDTKYINCLCRMQAISVSNPKND